MPTVDENAQNWSADWDWSEQGDEWSRWWGDTPALWYGAILPRIHSMVPAGTILEIAPGFGRWTNYLKDLCDQLVVVDLTERCIDHCRERFADAQNITYHVNDGRSLHMVEDGSVDVVFSFDSLVHVDRGVIAAYLRQLASKLRPTGVGFIHHSNAGSLKTFAGLAHRLPDQVRPALVRRGLAFNLAAWRDDSVSAAIFREECERAGLECVTQELVSWEFGGYLIDCFSVFAPQGSPWSRPLQVMRNPLFVAEARRMARLYAHNSFVHG